VIAARRNFVLAILLAAAPTIAAKPPDVQAIIEKSVQANQSDFAADPNFNYKETDRVSGGSKTYQVTMIEGTPYNRLVTVNGKSLSPDQERQEIQKQRQVTAQRKAESPQQRQQRIAKWQQDRTRDNNMMDQLTKAFDFKAIGEGEFRGFRVWRLRATPKRGYQPPNRDAQVLTGMQGELWIDQKAYQWVRVTAQVIHPVSIEGFLAQVEPGTRFEMDKIPVEGGSWQASHFSMHSHAKVLFLFHRSSSADETYFDYRPVNKESVSSSN
jgi:hypothetical protein